MKKSLKISVITFGLLVGLFGTWHLSHTQSISEPSGIKSGFQGRLLAASDADMIATAYANGVLNKVSGIEDSLALIQFKNGKPSKSSQLHISNSVVSWPSVLAYHSLYNYAYVAETRGIHQEATQSLKNVFTDLPKGTAINLIDFTKPDNPQLLQQLAVGENIQGVSINADGNFLVAGSTEKGKEIILVQLEEGKLGSVSYFPLPTSEQREMGVRTIEFHPTEDIIAANIGDKELVFFQIKTLSNSIQIDPIGQSIEVAKHWSVGNWHPNGGYFILTDVAWGDGPTGAILNGKGKLVSVKFDQGGNHQIVSQVKVGLSPEGFDISPNGQYAIVVNMRRTYGPKNFWFVPARKGASLSLVKIDPSNGHLSVLGDEYGFEGALPEDAVFDAASNSIAVAVFHEQDEEMPEKGWIDLWELREEKLIKTEERISTTRGVHNLLLVK